MPQGQRGRPGALALPSAPVQGGSCCFQLGMSRRVRPPSQPQLCQGQGLACRPAPLFLRVRIWASGPVFKGAREEGRTVAARGALWSEAHLWIQVRPQAPPGTRASLPVGGLLRSMMPSVLCPRWWTLPSTWLLYVAAPGEKAVFDLSGCLRA